MDRLARPGTASGAQAHTDDDVERPGTSRGGGGGGGLGFGFAGFGGAGGLWNGTADSEDTSFARPGTSRGAGRPGTASGFGGGNDAGGGRPGTSHGASNGRPGTRGRGATGRLSTATAAADAGSQSPTTAANGSNRISSRPWAPEDEANSADPTALEYKQRKLPDVREIDIPLNTDGRNSSEFYEEEDLDYESSDDGDVFAYKPPGLGDPVELVANPVGKESPPLPQSDQLSPLSNLNGGFATPTASPQLDSLAKSLNLSGLGDVSTTRHRASYAAPATPTESPSAMEMQEVFSSSPTDLASRGRGMRSKNDPRLSPGDSGRIMVGANGKILVGSDGKPLRPSQAPQQFRHVLRQDLHEDSPFVEVRGSVSNVDDQSLPCSTFRGWVIGFLIITIFTSTNIFFTFRNPAPQITTNLLIILAWPFGRAAARFLPRRSVTLPKFLGGASFSLNPGPWSMKEHGMIALMATMTPTDVFSFTTYMLVVQELPIYWNDPQPFGYAILFCLSIVLFAGGLAGMLRRFFVRPASMLWPQNLQATLLLNVLFAELGVEGNSIATRVTWFWLLFTIAFVWFFVPGYLFQALSQVRFLTWIFPDSVAINYIFGFRNGLALFPLTFDWAQVGFFGPPLVAPWWTGLNVGIGYFVVWCIVGPCLYFSKYLSFAYMPPVGRGNYDNMGRTFNVSRVASTTELRFNNMQYDDYSPLFLSLSQYLVYWSSLAVITALVVHTLLYHHKFLWRAVRYGKAEDDDIHARQMLAYKDIPDWAFFIVMIVGFALGAVAVEVYTTQLPAWGLLLAAAIVLVYVIPITFIQALTTLPISVNVTAELVVGYVLPSSVIPNMIFKTYASACTSGTTLVLKGLKLAHYLKIAPYQSALAIGFALIWGQVVQLATYRFFTMNVPDLCTPTQPASLTCPGHGTFYNASVIWGLIGPSRFFAADEMYGTIYWALLLGGLAPIPMYAIANHSKPGSVLRFINLPVLLWTVSYIGPVSPANIVLFIIVNLSTQLGLRRWHFDWWDRFNYLTGAALDAGTALSGIVIFLALQLPRNVHLDWVGQTVGSNTRDAMGKAWLPVPPTGIPR